MLATFNRYAAFDPDSDEETSVQTGPVADPFELSGPVTYSFETTKWNLDNTIYYLRQFKLQNITADKRGTIFLRFSHEAQAKQVLRWLTDQIKVNAKITCVPNSSFDPKCYYCSRLGHWASECQESLLSMFPSELITLISSELRAPDLFDFMLCSKTVFNAIANRQRTIVIARPYWHAYHPMKLKLGLLKYFKSVEKVVLRSLRCLITAIPMNVIATQYTRLTSLTINNCCLSNPNDSYGSNLLDESWIRAMTRMTQLRKLDLDCQDIPMTFYKMLQSATHLTQLRSNVYSFDDDYDPVPTGVKKLSLKGYNLSLHLQSDQLKSLYLDVDYASFHTRIPLPSLERLTAPFRIAAFDAPNLTKLALYHSHYNREPVAENDKLDLRRFPKLKALLLLLSDMNDPVDLSGQSRLTKLTLSTRRYACMDLSPLISLKKLHLINPQPSSIINTPACLQVLRITFINIDSRIEKELLCCSELENLKITRFECLLSEQSKRSRFKNVLPRYFDKIGECRTLREMKVECDHRIILPYYSKFTQLHVLDLVQPFKRNCLIMAKAIASHEDIIELSKQLPNTRIYHGYDSARSIQRPKKEHWSYRKRSSDDEPDYCCCEYCQATYFEENYVEEEKEPESSSTTICYDPKPFKEHWSWY